MGSVTYPSRLGWQLLNPALHTVSEALDFLNEQSSFMDLQPWLCRGRGRGAASPETVLSKRLGTEAGSPWCEQRPPGTPESICSPADGNAPAEQVQPCCSPPHPAFCRPKTWLSTLPRVTLLNASPSTLEKQLAGGGAAAGGSVGSDVETESEAGSSIGLHCQLSDVGPDEEVLTEPWLKLPHPYWSPDLNPTMSEGDCFLIVAIFLLGLVTRPGIKRVILSCRKLFCGFCAKSGWNLLPVHFNYIHRTVTHYCIQVQQEHSQNPRRRNLRLLNALLLAATTVCAPHVFVIT